MKSNFKPMTAINHSNELVFFPSWAAGRQGYAERIRGLFKEYLKTQDLMWTTQREAILNHLLAADRHLSLEDIYAALKGRGIGKVTVFRTLKLLEECRLVEKIADSKGVSRYEVEMERPHHDHLICVACGRIIEIQWPQIEKVQEKECRKIGFTVLYHRHELFGRCKDCSVAAV
jgi:Fur family ferric uptake transcriptional regulator